MAFTPIETSTATESGFTPIKETSGFTPVEQPKKGMTLGESAKAAASDFQGAADVILGTPAFIAE